MIEAPAPTPPRVGRSAPSTRAGAPAVLAERMRAGLRAQVHPRAVMADAGEHAWRRRLHLRSLATGADWEAHARRTREAFRRALGPLPAPSPSGVVCTCICTGTLERRGYVLEKLLLETQPRFFVTAHLYLPARRAGPAPAVLNPVGHWEHGKSQDVEQARCAGLARKGYVALIWDPLGQGERAQFLDEATGAPWQGPGTLQHAAVCNPAFLLGSTVIATMVWDGVRLLDYLAARPEVDANRIGCTGVSGGGTYTMFLGAFDRRLKATVPVCSTSSLERMHRDGLIGEPCQDPLRAYPEMLDMGDLLLAHAPAAVRIIGTRFDFFPLPGLCDAALDVRDGYAAMGIAERADLCVVDAHHDYNRQQRELMYAWMNRWLEHDAPVAEEPFEPEAPRTLWCTPTGQCLTAGVGRTAPDLVRDLAARTLPAPAPLETREDARRERDRVLAAVKDVLGPVPPGDGAPPRSLSPVKVGAHGVERVVVEARTDVPLPALVFLPEGTRRRWPAVVLLDDRGKSAASGLAADLAGAGLLALAADLRGWGETAWVSPTFDWSQDRRDLLSADNMLAYVSFMTGHWPVTQRVQDALGLLAYLRARPDVDAQRVSIVGRGGGAVVALHAAALDGAVAGVALVEALATYRSAVEAGRCAHPVADFLPGVLHHYDLPDLAGALAPAGVLSLDPESGAGLPLTEPEAEAAYARGARLASLLGGALRTARRGPDAEAGQGASEGGRRRALVEWATAVAGGDSR